MRVVRVLISGVASGCLVWLSSSVLPLPGALAVGVFGGLLATILRLRQSGRPVHWIGALAETALPAALAAALVAWVL